MESRPCLLWSFIHGMWRMHQAVEPPSAGARWLHATFSTDATSLFLIANNGRTLRMKINILSSSRQYEESGRIDLDLSQVRSSDELHYNDVQSSMSHIMIVAIAYRGVVFLYRIIDSSSKIYSFARTASGPLYPIEELKQFFMSPAGDCLLTNISRRGIEVWTLDASSIELASLIPDSQNGTTHALCFSAGILVVSAGLHKRVSLWNLSDCPRAPRCVRSIKIKRAVPCYAYQAAICPLDQVFLLVLCGGGSHTVDFWKVCETSDSLLATWNHVVVAETHRGHEADQPGIYYSSRSFVPLCYMQLPHYKRFECSNRGICANDLS